MKKFILQLLFSVVLFAALFFNLFVSKMPSVTYVLVALIIFLILSIAVNGIKKKRGQGVDDAMMIIVGFSVILLTLMYMVGLKSGFEVSYNSILKNYITKQYWFTVFAIVIITEIARYVISQMQFRDKKQRWLLDGVMFLCFFLVDVSVTSRLVDYHNFNQLYEFFALVFVQSIAKNLFLTYVSRKYGYKPTISYRLIIDLYPYFIPVLPKFNIFIESVILLAYPYMLYCMMKKMMNENEKKIVRAKKEHKVFDRIITTASTVIFAVLVALVSREFSHCMIAIGSESMTGAYNKGDAIVYRKYDSDVDKLNEGDVVVFVKNNTTIVHRIYKVFTDDGNKVYQTKGDFNKNVDNWIVTQDDLVGIVTFRVMYIGWPSVWLSEIF